MKTFTSIKMYLIAITTLTLNGISAQAYPGTEIVDTLPGTYHGTFQGSKIPCEVKFVKQDEIYHLSIKRTDGFVDSVTAEPVSDAKLKDNYVENLAWRKEQDKEFSPEISNPDLNYYTNYGTPSRFGVYPRTDNLYIKWDMENELKLYSVKISVTYDNGLPFKNPGDSESQYMDCAALQKE